MNKFHLFSSKLIHYYYAQMCDKLIEVDGPLAGK